MAPDHLQPSPRQPSPLQPSLLGEDPATAEPAAREPTATEATATVHTAGVIDAPAGPPDLAALERDCRECRRCGLAEGRRTVVVSRGDPAARLMVIGEGPGAQEDASGRPFVGRAGQLLDQMLASVGLDSERDAYVCNVVKCRPPDNRRPTPQEIAACAPWLAAQIAAVDPAVVLLAGATALEGVLGIKGGITRLRGRWHPWQGRWVMPVFHPSYLLRNPSREKGSPKWLTWQDLQEVRRRLEEDRPPTPSL
ncbi:MULTISPECIES: uracil-DNA glycosylase [Cyanophyceae]|nr:MULTISPECIES: uracil-DNA glycosylase [Cyanophyceae]